MPQSPPTEKKQVFVHFFPPGELIFVACISVLVPGDLCALPGDLYALLGKHYLETPFTSGGDKGKEAVSPSAF